MISGASGVECKTSGPHPMNNIMFCPGSTTETLHPSREPQIRTFTTESTCGAHQFVIFPRYTLTQNVLSHQAKEKHRVMGT